MEMPTICYAYLGDDMYFSIDFYNADNWKEENKLYFENAKELLRYQLEQLRPDADKRGESIPEVDKMPAFPRIFGQAMYLAQTHKMGIEVVFIKNRKGIIVLSAKRFLCKEDYGGKTRKAFLELCIKAKEFCLSPRGGGIELELHYDLY